MVEWNGNTGKWGDWGLVKVSQEKFQRSGVGNVNIHLSVLN